MLAYAYDRPARYAAHPLAAAFVDIVAIAEDKVHILCCRVAPGGIEALLVMLAAAHGKAYRLNIRPRSRQRAGPAHHAALAPGREPVEIRPPRLQARYLDMHRMAKLWPRERLAGLYNRPEAFILGDLPQHRNNRRGHAMVLFQRPGRQARPDHEAVGRRFARSNAQLEGIVCENRLGNALAIARQGGEKGGAAPHPENLTAGNLGTGHGGLLRQIRDVRPKLLL